ncbi:hypothetical protein BRO01_06360 [Xanthomonas oryzae pv. oryzae]|nr:hypothetical protein BRO01_06360 [Xanthomonas oryzae pv. oryzae]
MPPHSEQIVSRICGALFRGSLAAQHARLPRNDIAHHCHPTDEPRAGAEDCKRVSAAASAG